MTVFVRPNYLTSLHKLFNSTWRPRGERQLKTAHLTDSICTHTGYIYAIDLFITSPHGEVRSIAIFMCLCLAVGASVCLSQHVQTSRNLVYVLPVAVARYFFDNNALRYLLPVLWMVLFDLLPLAAANALVRRGRCGGITHRCLHSAGGGRVHSPPQRGDGG